MSSFHDALLWHMSRHNTKIAELAEGSGVSADAIKKLRTRPGGSTNAEYAARIAAFYGKSVRAFLDCDDASDAGIEDLARLLTPDERRIVAAQIRGMLSAREKL